MVYFKGDGHFEVVKAFLKADLTEAELDEVHRTFELGSMAKFDPTMRLFIENEPRYRDMSHSEIRKDQTAQGNTSAFLIIDSDTPKNGAVWYVDEFATEEEVEEGTAESTEVLWQIQVKADHVSIMKVNYDIANCSLLEDLDNCGIADHPLKVNYEQPELHDSGIDMKEYQHGQAVWVVAEPAEYEETSDPEQTKRFLSLGGRPRHPTKVARLKDDVARNAGIKNGWAIPCETTEVGLPDGTKKAFPEGSVTLQLKYDPDHPWPPYRRLEGSL